MHLDACLYLGDRWEYRLRAGDFAAKAFGPKALPEGPVWVDIPRESVWLFARAA